MSFSRKDYEFLRDIGISPRNPGCFVNGSWKAHGPLVSTLNPANNQVLLPLLPPPSFRMGCLRRPLR
ncbi:hypothetical protein MLD38_004801 [Melastoma candidum]|uniref:Uncharacterized protein n=1 Tax=Melastoma candidum TaxID=119954 RepID=A0ACB9S632_9MYRT|nr:hypothetical protein MLD38_004801 [Melastoma candidum]